MLVLFKEIQDTLKAVRPAVEEFQAAAKAVRQTAETANVTLTGLNELFSPENRKLLGESIKSLNATLFLVLKLAGTFQSLLNEAEKAAQGLNRRLDQVGDILGDVRAVTRPLALRADELVTDVAEGARQAGRLLAEVREVVRTFARADGTIQRLLTDATVYQNLDAATLAVARVLARTEKIARDLEVFADKVARRPELIGVGGALRPSSGLKNSPFAPVPDGIPSYRPDWPPAIPAPRLGDPLGTPPPVQGLPPRP